LEQARRNSCSYEIRHKNYCSLPIAYTLATSSSVAIKDILTAAGDRYRMHDPGTWPTQSSLAAQGRWDELNALKEELDGGR